MWKLDVGHLWLTSDSLQREIGGRLHSGKL